MKEALLGAIGNFVIRVAPRLATFVAPWLPGSGKDGVDVDERCWPMRAGLPVAIQKLNLDDVHWTKLELAAILLWCFTVIKETS